MSTFSLVPIEPPQLFELSPEASAMCKTINASIVNLLARRQRHQAETVRIADVDVLELDAADKPRRKLHAEAIEMLKAELTIHRRLEEWRDLELEEFIRADREAETALAAVKNDVREKLLEIGFVWREPPFTLGAVPAGTLPTHSVVAQHPDVYKARMKSESLHAAMNRIRQQHNNPGDPTPAQKLDARIRAMIGEPAAA